MVSACCASFRTWPAAIGRLTLKLCPAFFGAEPVALRKGAGSAARCLLICLTCSAAVTSISADEKFCYEFSGATSDQRSSFVATLTMAPVRSVPISSTNNQQAGSAATHVIHIPSDPHLTEQQRAALEKIMNERQAKLDRAQIMARIDDLGMFTSFQPAGDSNHHYSPLNAVTLTINRDVYRFNTFDIKLARFGLLVIGGFNLPQYPGAPAFSIWLRTAMNYTDIFPQGLTATLPPLSQWTGRNEFLFFVGTQSISRPAMVARVDSIRSSCANGEGR